MSGPKSAEARVLLLERNAFARESAAAWLRLNNLDVCEVATQGDAIREVATGDYQVAVTDLSPSNPEELSLLIWLHEKHPEVAVVALLRNALSTDLRTRFPELNIRAALRKPYVLAALCDTVRDVVRRGNAQHAGRGVPLPLSAVPREI